METRTHSKIFNDCGRVNGLEKKKGKRNSPEQRNATARTYETPQPEPTKRDSPDIRDENPNFLAVRAIAFRTYELSHFLQRASEMEEKEDSPDLQTKRKS